MVKKKISLYKLHLFRRLSSPVRLAQVEIPNVLKSNSGFFQDLIVWNVLNTQPPWSEVDTKINPFWRHFSLPLPHPLMWRKKLNFRGGDNGISFPVIQSNHVLILPAFFTLWCGPEAITIGAHTEEGSTGTKWEKQNVSHQNKNRLTRGGVELGGKLRAVKLF